MRKSKPFILIVHALILALTSLPMTIRATVDSIRPAHFTISVDNQTYELWGYTSEWAVLYLCLHDMAYMLRGTAAQFDIREPLDDRWDFWIIRGGAYSPTGNEFQPIPEDRWVTRSDMGHLFGWQGSGFDYYPEQTLIIGVDGEEEPATSVAVKTIIDVDNSYIMVSYLAALLGFDFQFTNDPWEEVGIYVEGFDYVFTTGTRPPAELPIQSPEMLDILIRASGEWVDIAFFESPYIDESIIWPIEMSIHYYGINKPAIWSVSPIRPEWTIYRREWEWFWWYPMTMETIENGMVELTVSQSAQRQPAWSATINYPPPTISPQLNGIRMLIDPTPREIIDDGIFRDPRQGDIDSIILYIGDNRHVLRRFNWAWDYDPVRYQVLPTDNGGIMLRYLLHRWAFGRHETMELRIYRSPAPINEGGFVYWQNFDRLVDRLDMELVFSQTGIDIDDRIIFEFIDRDAEHGRVYYYSIWRMGDNHHENITPAGNYIRVDVNEIVGEPEPTPEPTPEPYGPYEPYEIYGPYEPYLPTSIIHEEPETTPASSRQWVMIPIVLVLTALAFVIYLRYNAHTR
ncbi:MAG: hypothetical protein FWC73_09775 [Defluviitaleaceae bacterium]|nr:hypothetical protein [Defluviitaleaceae bacterium]